jgi:hypothetical protein
VELRCRTIKQGLDAAVDSGPSAFDPRLRVTPERDGPQQ